jgi:hypothetical protein
MPTYFISSEAIALSALRAELGIGLRDAASKLGIRAVDLAGLEHGRLVPEDSNLWETMIRALRS